jgi:hypothetical protein
MITASHICSKIGRAELAKALGVGLSAVSNAATAGIFPASWYAVVRECCASHGIDCPTSIFSFKGEGYLG